MAKKAKRYIKESNKYQILMDILETQYSDNLEYVSKKVNREIEYFVKDIYSKKKQKLFHSVIYGIISKEEYNEIIRTWEKEKIDMIFRAKERYSDSFTMVKMAKEESGYKCFQEEYPDYIII